jgi:hypothetical protein
MASTWFLLIRSFRFLVLMSRGFFPISCHFISFRFVSFHVSSCFLVNIVSARSTRMAPDES